jgi:acyl-CoA hydrolase
VRGRIKTRLFFLHANTRRVAWADYVPAFLSDVPRLVGPGGPLAPRVVFIQCRLHEDIGWASLGPSVGATRAAMEAARAAGGQIVALVNDRVPYTYGEDAEFRFAEYVTAAVRVDTALPLVLVDPPTDIERTIAKHVATLIPNGATLQTGIGTIPDTVLAYLAERSPGAGPRFDLYTEMVGDGVLALAEANALDKVTTTFACGSERLMAWLDGRFHVRFVGADKSNEVARIADQWNMVAINGALAVDLTGQVSAESFGGREFSGVGGQSDFLRGATAGYNGRSIIALPSTAYDKDTHQTVSRITGAFLPGTAVTSSRCLVEYVVTEYGVAELRGKTLAERAEALAAIAHPQFRAGLRQYARGLYGATASLYAESEEATEEAVEEDAA